MIILFGKTCSGKTTIAEALMKKGLKKVVTCTTRPKRPNEADGRDYIFLSSQKFVEMKKNGEFAETADYVMAGDRHVSYGSLKKDYEDENGCIILSPSGIASARQAGCHATVFFVKVPDDVIRERLSLRGDDPAEADRRLKADDRDFADAEDLADFVVDGTESPDENADLIIRMAEGM